MSVQYFLGTDWRINAKILTMCLVGVVVCISSASAKPLNQKGLLWDMQRKWAQSCLCHSQKSDNLSRYLAYMNNQTLRKRNDKPIHEERSRISVYYCYRDSSVDILLYFLVRIHWVRRRLWEAQWHRLFRHSIASLTMHITMKINFSCDSLQLID